MVVRPLAFRCLSYPTGLALTEDEKTLFVSETGNNRLLRFYQTEQGIFYLSPFYQFAGRFGPMALSLGDGKIFVALFEFKNMTQDGCIAVLTLKGEMVTTIKLASIGPEISGLFIPKKGHMVYITENSGKPCYIRALIQKQEEEEHNPFEEDRPDMVLK